MGNELAVCVSAFSGDFSDVPVFVQTLLKYCKVPYFVH